MLEVKRVRIQQLLAAVAFLALVAVPVHAQSHRAALGVGGGWAMYGDLTPGLANPAVLESGWITSLELEVWPGKGRFGLRLGGTFTERSLEGAPGSNINVWGADLGLLARLLPAGRYRAVAPYVMLGAGAVQYNNGDDASPIGNGAYGNDPVERAALIAAVGTDFFASPRVGLRLEVADPMILPSVGRSPEAAGFPIVHNLQVRTALQLRMGRIAPVVLAHAAPPALRPAPPEPAPEASPGPGPDAAAERLMALLEEQSRELAELRERVAGLEREQQAGPVGLLGTPVAEAPAPKPAPAPISLPPADARHAGPIYTVQIGAYIEAATARRWMERLRARDLPAWVTEISIRGEVVNRVRVGALTTQSEAEELARALTRQFGWPAWVDQVRDDEPMPADALAVTRAFLSSGP